MFDFGWGRNGSSNGFVIQLVTETNWPALTSFPRLSCFSVREQRKMRRLIMLTHLPRIHRSINRMSHGVKMEDTGGEKPEKGGTTS